MRLMRAAHSQTSISGLSDEPLCGPDRSASPGRGSALGHCIRCLFGVSSVPAVWGYSSEQGRSNLSPWAEDVEVLYIITPKAPLF